MYNSLEGVLQHHIQILWGIGGNSVTSGYKMEKVNNNLLDNEEMLDAKIYEENQTAITQSNTTAYSRSNWPNLSSAFSSMDLDDNNNKDDFLPDSDGSSNSDDTSLLPLGYIFSQSSLAQIQDCIAHAVIPSWVD